MYETTGDLQPFAFAVLRVSSGRLGGTVGSVGSAFQDGMAILATWGEDRPKYEAIRDRVRIIAKNLRAFNKTLKGKVRKVYDTVERVLGKVTGPEGQGGFAQVVQSGESSQLTLLLWFKQGQV